jgi:hypothetical protein
MSVIADHHTSRTNRFGLSHRYLHELQRSAIEDTSEEMQSTSGKSASQSEPEDQRQTLEQLLGHQKLHLVGVVAW